MVAVFGQELAQLGVDGWSITSRKARNGAASDGTCGGTVGLGARTSPLRTRLRCTVARDGGDATPMCASSKVIRRAPQRGWLRRISHTSASTGAWIRVWPAMVVGMVFDRGFWTFASCRVAA